VESVEKKLLPRLILSYTEIMIFCKFCWG